MGYGLSRSASFSSLMIIGLCCGLNFGVEVSLFSVQGGLWSLSVAPLVAVAFLTYLFSLLFYVLSCGGSPGPYSCGSFCIYYYLPPVLFNLLLAASPSSLL